MYESYTEPWLTGACVYTGAWYTGAGMKMVDSSSHPIVGYCCRDVYWSTGCKSFKLPVWTGHRLALNSLVECELKRSISFWTKRVKKKHHIIFSFPFCVPPNSNPQG